MTLEESVNIEMHTLKSVMTREEWLSLKDVVRLSIERAIMRFCAHANDVPAKAEPSVKSHVAELKQMKIIAQLRANMKSEPMGVWQHVGLYGTVTGDIPATYRYIVRPLVQLDPTPDWALVCCVDPMPRERVYDGPDPRD